MGLEYAGKRKNYGERISGGVSRDLSDPAGGAFAITKSDATTFDGMGGNPSPTRSLYIGTAGDVTVKMENGAIILFPGVQAGSILPISVIQVRSTGTTAGGFVGLV